MEQKSSNKSSESVELIRCSKCGFPLFKQIRGKATKRIERQYFQGGKKYAQIEKFRAEALENGYLKIPVDGECPKCGEPYSISLITEDLLGVTFHCKGEIFEIINGKKKQIIKKRDRKRYKIYVK